jgi:hypothetical protein
MSSIELVHRECPVCGFRGVISEICIACHGVGSVDEVDAPSCNICSGTGESRTCGRCGANYWKARRRARDAAKNTNH